MKVVENNLREFKEIRYICEKLSKEIEELKRQNEIKAKQSQIENKALDDLKELSEIMKN